jgi:predicted ATPase
VKIGLLGGLRVEHDGRPVTVTGSMQLAVLFRLAVDAGTAVSYRAISEDIWGRDAPENTKAALQSIVSRLRSQLPADAIESTAGGYRLKVARTDVDALEFSDLVAAAETSDDAPRLASEALGRWAGEPWLPSEDFDWFLRDLRRDHARAIELGGSVDRTRPERDLPAQLTSLVGRETELETVAAQLAGNRLVTIIGTGGAGKTRLAIESASGRRGAILVELAPVGPSEIMSAILTATGREIRMAEGAAEILSSRDRAVDALRAREVLLVLDNCEHIIDSVAAAAQELLGALPQLRILATSREPLGVPGEAFVGLGSLPHPTDAQIATMSAIELEAFAALELFCQRAMSARGEPLSESELRPAATICARLDGLPLAIELAAAKLRTMGVDEVLAGLTDRFSLLTGGYRTALPRHQTLRAMIDWSWSLLGDEEREAMLQFSVFPAGLEAVEARALARELAIVDPGVFDALVDRSLLQRVRGRFRALETIREYGIERLAEAGRHGGALGMQARFMARRAREMDGRLRGPGTIEGLAWFDAEEDNIASALRYATGVPLPDLAVNIIVSCVWYWIARDRGDEAQGWFEVVAPLASRAEGTEARVIEIFGQAMTTLNPEDDPEPGQIPMRVPDGVAPIIEALGALEITRDDHDLIQLVPPLVSALSDAIDRGQWLGSIRVPEQSEVDLDPWPAALLHIARAAMAQNRGALSELGESSASALAAFGELGDLWGIALSEQMHAIWLSLGGRLEEALALNDLATSHMRDITPSWDLAQQAGLSIQMLLRLGRSAEALERAQAMLDESEEGGNPRAIFQSHLTAATLQVQLGMIDEATMHVLAVEGSKDVWQREPGQVTGMIEALKGSIAIHRGDLDDAEVHLRLAVAAAIRTQDQPIVGAIAITVGTYAAARGNIELAVRAVDFATSMIGAYDATDPQVIAIVKAAHEHGIGRPSTEVPGRPSSIEILNDLLE